MISDFLIPKNSLSNIFFNTYLLEKKRFDDTYLEVSKNARDKEYAKVVKGLPNFIFSFWNNKLEKEIIELYKSNYRLGNNIIDLISQTFSTINQYKQQKKPQEVKVGIKNWKLSLEFQPEFSSNFERCESYEDVAKELGKLIATYEMTNTYLEILEKLRNNENEFKVKPIREMESYKKYQTQLDISSSDNEIVWIYLKALNDYQESIGIYYILPNELIDDKRINKIVKRIEAFQLAGYENTEFGNNNVYMKITEKGEYAVENFKNFNQYKTYLEEKETKKNSNHNTIINNGANSTIQVGNDNKSSINISNGASEISKKIDEMIDLLLQNSEIVSKNKRDSIKTLEKLNEEVSEGRVSSNTWMKFLSLGDQISSIGGFVSTIVEKINNSGLL